jgi:hypothetical protein
MFLSILLPAPALLAALPPLKIPQTKVLLSKKVPAIAPLLQEPLQAKMLPSKMHLLKALRAEALPAALLPPKTSQILPAPKHLSTKIRVGVIP